MNVQGCTNITSCQDISSNGEANAVEFTETAYEDMDYSTAVRGVN